MKGKKAEEKDILLQPKADRRLLPNVPDISAMRKQADRRGSVGETSAAKIKICREGIRYQVSYPCTLTISDEKGRHRQKAEICDISGTGMLIRCENLQQAKEIEEAGTGKIAFQIIKGSMPEGMEGTVHTEISFVRSMQQDGDFYVGAAMKETLQQYLKKKKDRYLLWISSLLLFFIVGVIVLMRAESVIYFRFHRFLYLYSIIAAAFLLSRYLFGACYRPKEINPAYTPGVSVIIPCFNEEEWIRRAILSCMDQNYPPEQLEVIVVDDHSSDASLEKINEVIQQIRAEEWPLTGGKSSRIHCIAQEKNGGKREALAAGVKEAVHELVVFVDSDSFLEPDAIRNIVQPFQDPLMGGVSGRTDVANTYTNALTKMQAVRYYIAFRIMKAAEAYFDAVTCLSGPLSCYRKQIVLDHMDAWLGQKFLGQRATFGDDRSMTNFILRHHRTGYQDTAVCSTIVPNRHGVFLKQQMRWKRSWLRESLIAGSFMWRKEPFMAATFYMGLIVPIAAPVVVVYNLLYVPLTHHVFPAAFLTGLLMMSLLMSAAQLFLRKSSTWLFGLFFCIYYEAVLLWQMPVAWVTFWKSTWGTRMTPEDVLEEQKKEEKHSRKLEKKQKRNRKFLQKREERGEQV